MPRFERQALMAKFQDMVKRREPIIGGGAGTGISAKCEEAAGIDRDRHHRQAQAACRLEAGVVGDERGLDVDQVAAGGGFKQVLVDSGIGTLLADWEHSYREVRSW